MEKINSIMSKDFSLKHLWRVVGRPTVYNFAGFKIGVIVRKKVDPTKARSVHTALLRAAKNQGITVSIKNQADYLLIKRTK